MAEQSNRRANPVAATSPRVRIRGKSFMALILAPEPALSDWFDALDQQMRAARDFFAERPIIADLSALEAGSPAEAIAALDGLAARDLRLIGAEGIAAERLAGTAWAHLPTVLQGRATESAEPTSAGRARIAAGKPAPTPSLLIEGPVRSGQSICFEDGDVTVVGAVASGAEVIAGGSIHIYGALRGRAIAGLRTGSAGRVFCRRMEAELVGVDRLYRTAENWGPALHGRAVEIRCDRGALRLSALD